MMFRRLAWILAAILLLASCPFAAASESIAPDGILILCDSSPGAAMKSAERRILSILTYMGKGFTLAAPDDDFNPEDYGYVFVMIDPDRLLPEDTARLLRQTVRPVLVIGQGGIDQLSDDLAEFDGCFEVGYTFRGNLRRAYLTGEAKVRLLQDPDETYGGTIAPMEGDAYPLCARRGNLTQIAWFDEGAPWLPYAASDLISKWMWPYDNTPLSYGAYLVLDSVYPFEDPDLLMRTSDMLEEEGVPYAIMVMPLYDNATYPSMKRFCEYLRYAQSRGAAIVLRTPLVRIREVEPDELKQRIELAYEAYAQYGVYPLALAAPEAYLHMEAGLTVLRGVRTVMLFESDDVWSPGDSNLSYQDGHAVIAPAYAEGGNLYTGVYPSAVYLNLHDGVDALRKIANAYQRSVIPLSSLWSLDNTLYIGSHLFTSGSKDVAHYDGERVSLAYQPFQYEENYVYQRGIIFFLGEQIAASNRLILSLVVFFSLVLLALIWIARRHMKRQFLVRPPSDKNKDWGVGG